jgi:hypothetical protein
VTFSNTPDERRRPDSFSVFVGSVWGDHGMSSGRIAVCLEVTPKKTFASALDWPGWCRASRDEGAAREALVPFNDPL